MSKHDKSTSPDTKSSGRKSRLQEAAMKKFSDVFKPLFEKWKSEEEGRSQTVFGNILYHDVLKRTDIEHTQPAVSRWYRGVGSLPSDEELDGICQIFGAKKEEFEVHDMMDGFKYDTDTIDKVISGIYKGYDRFDPGFGEFLAFLKSMEYDDIFPLYTPLEFSPEGFDDKEDPDISYRRMPYSSIPDAAKTDKYSMLQVEKDGHYKLLSEADLDFILELMYKVDHFIEVELRQRAKELSIDIPLSMDRMMSSFGYDEDDKGIVLQKQLPSHLTHELYYFILLKAQQALEGTRFGNLVFPKAFEKSEALEKEWNEMYAKYNYIVPFRHTGEADVIEEKKHNLKKAKSRKEDDNGNN